MAQKNRTKEIWLIPKRVNLHQTICLIDGIIDRNYSGTSWNPQKQNNLGVNLKRWGATNDGKNISPQAIRTLAASIPQYLGFLYINTNTTPNTICLTDAGIKLWNTHKDELVKVKNLREGQDQLITESNILLEQMEKLQITNPIILKDCENILVFPFRFTLKLLLELDYLDREELAYIVFKVKDESENKLVLQEIKNFRKIKFEDRQKIIDAFKQTHIGNITLEQAPSAGYYETLCLATGIIDKMKVKVPNPGNQDNYRVTAIKIKDEHREYVKQIIDSKYKNAQTYDFSNNLNLWIEYIGNPNRILPPRNVQIVNKNNVDLLICIKKKGVLLDGDLIKSKNEYQYPMFLNEEYEIDCIDISNGALVSTYSITPLHNNTRFEIITHTITSATKETFDEIAREIIEHSNAPKFSRKMLNYLHILYNIDGKIREDDKYLRGAYYEFLFYKLLSKLCDNGIIDEVIWNGKIGKYGLPIQAPGGTNGTADIIFRIGDKDFILELTTIRPKSTQFKAEGASVPDHVRLYNKQTSNEVIGIFCAPQIHSRNTSIMQSSLKHDNIHLNCITDSDLLNIFKQRDRNLIISSLV